MDNLATLVTPAIVDHVGATIVEAVAAAVAVAAPKKVAKRFDADEQAKMLHILNESHGGPLGEGPSAAALNALAGAQVLHYTY